MSEKVKIKIGDAEFEASVTDAMSLLEAYRDGVAMYHSKSKGLIRVDSMDVNHLSNAIQRKLRDWAGVRRTPEDLLKEMMGGGFGNDATLMAMVEEMSRKIAEEVKFPW